MKKLAKVELTKNCHISSKAKDYISAKQLEYFSSKLQSMLSELENQDLNGNEYFLNGESESEKLIQRRKKRKGEIKNALERIKLGTYGYCERTGEEIGIERLDANPIAMYCIEEQERIELEKKMYNLVED